MSQAMLATSLFLEKPILANLICKYMIDSCDRAKIHSVFRVLLHLRGQIIKKC
jgi:hypothetical protein